MMCGRKYGTGQEGLKITDGAEAAALARAITPLRSEVRCPRTAIAGHNAESS